MRHALLALKLIAVVGTLLVHEKVPMPEHARDGLSVAVGIAALLTDPKRGKGNVSK